MLINRLIDEYEPLVIEKEILKILDYKKLVFEVNSIIGLSYTDLLKVPVRYLVSPIDQSSIQRGSYLNHLEPEQIPWISELYDIKYWVSLTEDKSKLIKESQYNTLDEFSEIPGEEFVGRVNKFYIVFEIIPTSTSVSEYFDRISIAEIYHNLLDAVVSEIKSLQLAKHVPEQDRHIKINFDFENYTYRFSNFGYNQVEKFKSACRFLFFKINDEKFYSYINSYKYEDHRIFLKTSHVSLMYNSKSTYHSTFVIK